ncbi:hypothetical protein B9Z55_011058 [Caenorhabditis nigoni]|uniref:Uncharacterized protein n=1 Tax=Caenorhabditis nigoni TaxID=1611254 RepID=A0A2G5UJ24_9PELO|nr:hypothetical protein B9Z55_011058 [Caenorhabditis nigoni]
MNQASIEEIANIMTEHNSWYSLTTKIINTPRLSKSKLHTVKVNGRSLSEEIKTSHGVDAEHPFSLTVVDKSGQQYAMEYIWVRLTKNEELDENLESEDEEEIFDDEEEEVFYEYEVLDEEEYEFRR